MTRNEMELIGSICQRAKAVGLNLHRDYTSLVMDIEYCHESTPLDLAGLLMADDANFSHDICGIQAHFDRREMVLKDCFVPRYAI